MEDDPVQIPHMYSQKEDIEISGLFSAVIAWGQRVTIIKNATALMARMDHAPYEYVMHANEAELRRLEGFVHRTFNSIDARAIVLGLRKVYQEDGGLEQIFVEGLKTGDDSVFHAIVHARNMLSSREDFPKRTHKHLANPAKGSSAKRLNMFLRWMVRDDKQGVDFGIWKKIPASLLVCPLDVHTGNVARKIGLLQRKQNDWKAASELTQNLKMYCPEDPVKYDFALFGLGVYGEI